MSESAITPAPASETPPDAETGRAGCGWSGRMFGAPYPDATCIEGMLWDLDSYDGEGLTSGGEIACPACNGASFLEDLLDSARCDIPDPRGRGGTPAEVWERALLFVYDLDPDAASAHVSSADTIDLLDRPGRVDSPERAFEEDPALVWRTWPWPVPGLSAHTLRRLMRPPADGKDTF